MAKRGVWGRGEMLHVKWALESPYKPPRPWVHSDRNLFILVKYIFLGLQTPADSGRITWVNTVFQKLPNKKPRFP